MILCRIYLYNFLIPFISLICTEKTTKKQIGHYSNQRMPSLIICLQFHLWFFPIMSYFIFWWSWSFSRFWRMGYLIYFHDVMMILNVTLVDDDVWTIYIQIYVFLLDRFWCNLNTLVDECTTYRCFYFWTVFMLKRGCRC